MVSQGGITHFGSYIASYDDVIGDQEEDEEFMHNPLNVYNLIRHVAVGWPVIEQVLEVNLLIIVLRSFYQKGTLYTIIEYDVYNF